MAASGCLERYMISSSVLRLYCVLQVFLADRIGTVASWMRFECYRICTKHCVSSGKRRFRCGEKLPRLRDGCGRRRFAVESVSNCARSGTEGSRRLILFFAAAVLLCFACFETLCALELVHQSDVF